MTEDRQQRTYSSPPPDYAIRDEVPPDRVQLRNGWSGGSRPERVRDLPGRTRDLHDALARGALVRLRAAAGLDGVEAAPDPEQMASLLEALADDDRGRLGGAISNMIARGILPHEIVDLYLPAAARLLGEAWVSDTMSFVAVTVGTARLQALLRDLGEMTGPPDPAEARGRTALLILREGDNHSLGAMIAAAQLRRASVSVRLCLGRPDREALDTVRGGGFDMIAFSAGAATPLDAIRAFIGELRRAAPAPVAIALGGSVATETLMPMSPHGKEHGADSAVELERIRIATGADHISVDIVGAATACGLIEERRRVPGVRARPCGASASAP